MVMILLDTNAIIYYLQNDQTCVRVISSLRKKKNTFAISTVTELEIFSLSSLDTIQILRISQWLQDFSIIPLDSSLARKAAQLRREFRIKTPDAIVAATALFYKTSLVTRDREMNKIKDLKIIKC